MKKIKPFLLSLCLLGLMILIFTISVSAADKTDITQTYFATGKLTTPAVPYLHPEDSCVTLFYEQIPELMKLAEDYQIFEEQNPDVNDNYLVINGVSSFCKRIQIDYKFDENPWASTKGDWNAVDGNSFNTGSDEYYEICFAVSNSHDTLYEDDNCKLDSITYSDLYYYNPDDSMYSYLHPYVIENGEGGYVLNLVEHTLMIRIRWYATYEENGVTKTFFSDWSDTTSIGKAGTQEEATLPELEAPILSDFSLEKDDNGSVHVRYYIDIPDSAYKANRYHYIHDHYYDSYILEAQVKKDKGEWADVYTANGNWLVNGYRSASDLDSLEIDLDDEVALRVRIVCGSFEEAPSPWSNIIGTNVEEGYESSVVNSGKTAGESSKQTVTSSEKQKCKVCGICPIQPLGICLFLWIAMIIVVILVIVIIIVVAVNKKDKRNKQQNF